MSDAPIRVVVAVFATPVGVSQMLATLDTASRVGLVSIADAAVLTQDAHGNLHVEEPGDRGGRDGAMMGGVVGAALGILAGPVGWAAGVGAVIGGLAAELHDTGFSDARLRALGESLGPETSILVVAIEPAGSRPWSNCWSMPAQLR